MNRYIISILVLAAMAGCTKEVDTKNNTSSDNNIVTFSSTTTTRSIEVEQDGDFINMWESGDAIGITTDGFDSDYTNIEYRATTETTATTTSFLPKNYSDAISYPESTSSDVIFYAYYPYSNLYEEGVITVDVSNQEGDIGSVDFMTASCQASYSEESYDEISLQFDHNLTKLVLNITIDEEVGDFTDITVTAKNTYATAKYDLEGAQIEESLDNITDIELTTVLASDKKSAVATAILHPCENYINGLMFVVTLDEQMYSVNFEETFSANTVHTTGIKIGGEY